MTTGVCKGGERSLLPLLSPFHFCQGRSVWHSIFIPLLFLLNIFIVHITQTQNIGCCHKLDGEIPDKICQVQKTMNSFKRDKQNWIFPIYIFQFYKQFHDMYFLYGARSNFVSRKAVFGRKKVQKNQEKYTQYSLISKCFMCFLNY